MNDTVIRTLDRCYLGLHERSCGLIAKITPETLFRKPKEAYTPLSGGEYILRSAGLVEQTFGGITARLWDDPFEWTLPEELATPARVSEYLGEVEATRTRGFALFKTDENLRQTLPAPEKMTSLIELLVRTLAGAENLQGRARAVFALWPE